MFMCGCKVCSISYLLLGAKDQNKTVSNLINIVYKQGRKRPLDTPKRMIERRERRRERERER